MVEHVPGIESRELTERLASFSEECILRLRRGTQWWEGSNREWRASRSQPRGTSAFRTASVTKTFTAALAFRLIERGKLSLSDPIAMHLPGEVLDLALGGRALAGNGITLGQLLNHSSGLYDYATDPDFIAAVRMSPDRRWHPLDLLAASKRGRPYFAPGAGVAYSDTGYVLLGLIIEAVTALPLALNYRQLISEPLGLSNTYLEGAEVGSELAVAHAYQGELDTYDFDPSFDAFGGGGLISTARELDRFISALMGGVLFEMPSTLDSMLRGAALAEGHGTRKTLVACGISEFEIAGVRLWGHLGHWNSFMFHAPSKDMSVCGTFNQSASCQGHIETLECAVVTALGWSGR